MTLPGERARLGIAVLLITGFRLAYGGGIGLAPDEAYYWQWSNHLALAYPDHPPLVAWLIRLGTWLLGPTALGVRLCFILLGAAGVWLAFRLARAAGLNDTDASLAALLVAILPIPSVGSIIATPDTPLGVAWMLALLALVDLARGGPARSWYLLGFAFGLGLLSKHSALLIPVAGAIAAGLDPRIRKALRTPHPWLALLLATAIALPYLAAEVGQGLASLSFQLAHLTGGLSKAPQQTGLLWAPLRIGELLAGQVGLLTPPVALWAAASCVTLRRDPGNRVLALGFLVPLVAALGSALVVQPEQNWGSLGHPAAAIGALLALERRYAHAVGRKLREKRIWKAAILLTAFAFTALIHAHAARPFLPLPPERDPVSRLHGWEALAPLVQGAKPLDAVVCNSYGLAAEAAWQMGGRDLSGLPVVGIDRPPAPPRGRWLILSDTEEDLERFACASMQSAGRIVLRRADGKPWRTISAYLGSGCRLSPGVGTLPRTAPRPSP